MIIELHLNQWFFIDLCFLKTHVVSKCSHIVPWYEPILLKCCYNIHHFCCMPSWEPNHKITHISPCYVCYSLDTWLLKKNYQMFFQESAQEFSKIVIILVMCYLIYTQWAKTKQNVQIEENVLRKVSTNTTGIQVCFLIGRQKLKRS